MQSVRYDEHNNTKDCNTDDTDSLTHLSKCNNRIVCPIACHFLRSKGKWKYGSALHRHYTHSDVNIARHQTENMLEYDNKTCCFPWRPPMQYERGTKRRLDSSSMSVALNKFEFLDSWHRRHLQLIWDYISRSMFHSYIKIGPNRVLHELGYEAGIWRYYCAHFIFLIFLVCIISNIDLI